MQSPLSHSLLAITISAIVWCQGFGQQADSTRQPGASENSSAPMAVLENPWLRVEVDRVSGAIVRLQNRKSKIELIQQSSDDKPWQIQLSDRILNQAKSCEVKSDHNRIKIHWHTEDAIELQSELVMRNDANRLEITAQVFNPSTATIISLSYPMMHGIGTLSQTGEADRLLHSQLMGSLFRDPFHLFQHDHARPFGKGVVASRFPNGFHGSTLQMLAYYAESQGGFYVATEDDSLTDKEFNFFKENGQGLCCEIKHFQSNASASEDLQLNYKTVISALTEGNWYEAAERYREWGDKQWWCERGTRAQRLKRNDASSWLLQDTGVVGMWWPFQSDVRKQIEQLRATFDAPSMHLELSWLNQDSVAMARQSKSHFGPFYFPHLAQRGKSLLADFDTHTLQPTVAVIDPDWVAMCPADSSFRGDFVAAGREMVDSKPRRYHQIWMEKNITGCSADVLYFDIGPCAGVPTHCYSKNHGHTPGAGRQITHAHRKLLSECQREVNIQRESYIPIGTECISEAFLDSFDFYYARNAGLSVDMELFPWVRELTWLPDGKMKIVPLFEFIYHGHAPLPIQGVYSTDPWTTKESEPYCIWAEARSYLWSGLITTMPIGESKVSEERTRFLQSLTAARTKFASAYLGGGTRMLRPPRIDCPTLEIDHGLQADGWLRKLRFPTKNATDSDNSKSEVPKSELSVDAWVESMLKLGATPASTNSLSVPSVQSATYTAEDGKIGILLVSLSPTPSEKTAVDFSSIQCGGFLQPCSATLKSRQGAIELGTFIKSVELDLPSQEMVLLELTPIDPRN